ncbi:MAG: MFS transporter [Deltaproteobacteria bacterium]|nr:MFS transporter [Deltaproteobacteria bacterium]
MTQPKTSSLKRYGLVGLGFAHLGVSRGVHGTFSVCYVAFIEAFGWSRAAAAGALSLAVITEGLSLPLVGSFTDRLGPRRTLLLGGVTLALGLGFTATVSSLWELYFWLGLVTALGLGLIGMVPHIAILSREFSERRGTALGLAFAGGGFGIMILVPLSQLFISRWGWPAAYVGLAVLTAVLVIPPVLLFFPAGPSKSPADQAHGAASGKDWTVARALRSLVFWLLFGARVLASMGNQIIITHQIAYAVDVGFSKLFAASIFGLMGICSIFGRVFFGYLTDRIRGEPAFAWVQAVSVLGIVSLLLLKNDSLPQFLYAYAIFYGLGQGSRALVLSAISADIFLGKSFGAILGYFTLSIGVGGAMGSWLGGFIHDVTGSYTSAFVIALFCFLVSVIAVWVTRGMVTERAKGREQ